MYRRCKVNRISEVGWSIGPARFAWVPTREAHPDREVALLFPDGDDSEARYVIVELDTLVISGRFLPHVEEWPVERAS